MSGLMVYSVGVNDSFVEPPPIPSRKRYVADVRRRSQLSEDFSYELSPSPAKRGPVKFRSKIVHPEEMSD